MATWWITSEEAKDTEFMNSLKLNIRKYQRQDYLTATFLSGSQNLESNTRQLMKHNYELHSAKGSLALAEEGKAFSICCQCCMEFQVATFILIIALEQEMCYNVAR
jgi:hypothetical protein